MIFGVRQPANLNQLIRLLPPREQVDTGIPEFVNKNTEFQSSHPVHADVAGTRVQTILNIKI